MSETVRVFAPATVANVAVGFDVLSFAFEGIGDVVAVRRIAEPRVLIREIGEGTHPSLKDVSRSLPRSAARNCAGVGLQKMIRSLKLKHGFEVSLVKGIPIGSGMGGSAASAVGAAVAANFLLEKPLGSSELFEYALLGEKAASGALHGDNVAACLWGGLTLVRSLRPADVVRIPVPQNIHCVLVHPQMRLDTRRARKVLKRTVPLEGHVRQSADLGAFVAACFSGDTHLAGRALNDSLIEPQRARLIPGFALVKKAALDNGALGCSISGAGPSLFAWVVGLDAAERVRGAMLKAFEKVAMPCDAWIAPVARGGAHRV